MKRAMAITLIALGTGGVIIYAASEDGGSIVPDDGSVFASKEQCMASGTVAADDCARGWDAALKAHEAKAPHYATTLECEAVYGPGQCVTPSGMPASAAAYVIPAMAAYMIGRSWPSEGCPAAPLLRQRGDAASQYRFPAAYPGCHSRTYGHAGTGGSSGGSSWHGWSQTSSSVTTTTSRGGFGTTGRGFSASFGS